MSAPIVVVDYHKGNLLSVARGLSEVGGEAEVTDDPARIAEAAGVVLPGVGAFEDAMAYLRQSGQDEAILSAIGRGVPFLGICLGLQLLFERGDERCDGALHGPDDPERWAAGLGVLPGSVSPARAPQGAARGLGPGAPHAPRPGLPAFARRARGRKRLLHALLCARRGR